MFDRSFSTLDKTQHSERQTGGGEGGRRGWVLGDVRWKVEKGVTAKDNPVCMRERKVDDECWRSRFSTFGCI